MELELLEYLNRIVADRYRAVLMRTLPVLDTGPKGGPSMKVGELKGLGSLAGLPARVRFVFAGDADLRLVAID